MADGDLETRKRAGKLANLEKALAEAAAATRRPPTGMGHTRWATHGAPNRPQRPPAPRQTARVAVIHNGIIENFAALRAELEAAGVELRSDTDTEVVAHLLSSEAYAAHRADLAEAMRLVCRRLEGAFTLRRGTRRCSPDVVVGARRNSPLVVGVGDGENFLGSDVAAFIAHTREAVELGQDQVVEIRAGGVAVTDFDGCAGGRPARTTSTGTPRPPKRAATSTSCSRRSPSSPRPLPTRCCGRIGTDGRLHLDEMRLSDEELREVDKIVIIACGTAYHSGLLAKYAIEHWTRIPCEVEIASEFRYRDPILDPLARW